MVRHPPEILKRTVSSLVVVRAEVIRTSSFGVWMPVIVGSVTPVVPVVAVLLVWSFSRRGVVAVTARAAVGVSVRPSITVVVLIAMRVIGMMPISLPR